MPGSNPGGPTLTKPSPWKVLLFIAMKKNLKNIIIDLGGVIINLDYHRTARAFQELGISDFDEIYSKAKQSSLFDDFEKGILSNANFRLKLREYLPSTITDAEIDLAWNAMLLDIPNNRLQWLQEVAKKYRIFLLSNTNMIHVKAFTKIADDSFGDGVLEATFEKTYLSCKIGMRKPDAEIFEKVVTDNHLEKEETLFIDDSIQHIHGAEKVGLPAEWLNIEKGERIEEKYMQLL
ncbi:HAD family phosphatase [soil metagenome]